MVLCSTITVISNVPDVVVTDKGFAANNVGIVDFCSDLAIVGKGIQFALTFQTSAPALVDVVITRSDPDGIIVSNYKDVSLPMGAASRLFSASPVGVLYKVGTYTITFVELLNIRAA